MNERTEQLRNEWDERARRLGNAPRSVLFKRFPGWINRRIHEAHVGFCLRHLPLAAASILDVGCGYGRISKELRQRHRGIRHLQGIELSPTFARAYQDTVGPCFNGPLQAFRYDQNYDVIIIVTVLMYLEPSECRMELGRLWTMLNPKGGRLICIEPAIEFLEYWRRLTRTKDAAPTGGHIQSFTLKSLENIFVTLPDSKMVEAVSIMPIPLLHHLPLHHAVAVQRNVVSEL